MTEAKEKKVVEKKENKNTNDVENNIKKDIKNNIKTSRFIINNKPLSLRGRSFIGKVISDKMINTVTVEWEWQRYIPKYERYEKKRTRVKAHNPEEINAKEGDIVKIVETRPISKTKNFVVVEIIKKNE